MVRIAVVDYGMGNIASVLGALNELGADTFLTRSPDILAQVDGIVLPGVGAFPQAMTNLKSYDLDTILTHEVVGRKKPFMGICLGMQLLATDSVEIQLTRGLGWIPGHIVELDKSRVVCVPHVGWNTVEVASHKKLFDNIPTQSHFFFDHSYHFIPSDPSVAVGHCDYGIPIVSALRRENIFATQFHPEKSQRNGLKLLRNFLKHAEEVEIAEKIAC